MAGEYANQLQSAKTRDVKPGKSRLFYASFVSPRTGAILTS
jgi:hypothetical protein